MAANRAIHGVTLTELREIADLRGAVLHMMRNDPTNPVQFGECYFSEVLPGAVKAWKRHRVQTQNIAVPVGRVRFVVYDDRTDSTTRGALMVLELGRPDAYRRLRLPPGLWYGFSCISPGAALIVNCADHPHDPQESETRPVNEPAVPYKWGS
jgi:dTDP-4-dehydrorhamnose 3,5-epimerase